MSFLRLLSPAHRSNSYQKEEPTLILRVDDYGFLYLTRVAQPFGPNDLGPGYASEPFSLRGSLEIKIPIGHGRCRCKAIKIALRSTCRLAMGPSRGWEEDVIFERVEKMEDEEGIWFDEGSTRFEFAFTLPYGFPAMDWHESAKIKHEVHASVEGLPAQSQGSRFLQSFRSTSPSAGPSRERSPPASRGRSPQPSRSPSPPNGEMASFNLNDASISMTSRSNHAPQTPTYEEAAGAFSGEDHWLDGTFAVRRDVRVIWNPNPTGGINSLDEKVLDSTVGLGGYEVRFKAPIWTISCILHTRVHFDAIPASATIFYIRVDLVQTVVVRSPREKGPDAESKAIRTTRRRLISSHGKRPPKDVRRPDVHRDLNMADKGPGEYRVVMKGRLPNDDDVRPSTLDGIVTPVHVSHHLVVEVVYSIWSHDQNGRPLDKAGPGDQRTLSIARSVILPGCVNIPERLSLPDYGSVPTGRLTLPDEPCPLCRKVLEDRFCTTCHYERPVHPRHDHPPKLVGNADGVCPVCSELVVHEGDRHWRNCACAMSFEELERLGEYIQKAGGAGAVQQWGDVEEGRKDEYQRGGLGG